VDLFAELCYCLLTPQTNAHACDEAVRRLRSEGQLLRGSEKSFLPYLRRVRFHHHKAHYLAEARRTFTGKDGLSVREALAPFSNPQDRREWLVDHVLGLGYKEASHFLRNVGAGEGLAILDRHILRSLLRYGILLRPLPTLTPKRYLRVEAKMQQFAKGVAIPIDELDLLWWSEGTGEIFK